MNRGRIGEVAEMLLDYFEHDKTYQAPKISSVPAKSYTDPEQWKAEIEIIFKRLPLMLALTCEMPKPGDYKAMEVVGMPVLIVRDKVGVAHAFLNVCAHRWAPVASEGIGNRSRFTCPFHGWTYALDGRLIAIADHAKFGELDRSKHGLKPLPCAERHGMIFVCLTPGAIIELDEYYGPLLEEYAYAGLENWTFLGSRVLESPNWKIPINNFLESYHFASLHPSTVFSIAPSNMTHFEGFGPNVRVSFMKRSITALREIPRAQWGEREGHEFGFIRFFFPNATGYLASGRELSEFTQTFPGATPATSRTVTLLLRKEPPSDDAERQKLEREIDAFTRDVADGEDNAVGMKIQRGLESGAHEGLLYGRNEPANQYFNEWVNWYLSREPSSPRPTL